MGFAGETKYSMREICLSFCIKAEAQVQTVNLNFLVVRAPSPYNVILGGQGLMKLGAVASTIHGMMKFPTPQGITTIVLENRIECQQVREIEAEKANDKKDEEQVHINTLHPDKMITLGKKMTKRKLVTMLKKSCDVFEWKPKDMTWIPREIAEHKLCVYKNVKPVVQKKRVLALDRSRAACKEVDQLVKADILREVRYRTLVANMVRVPKGDHTWRMCIDFKDINNAYPKDVYPLRRYK